MRRTAAMMTSPARSIEAQPGQAGPQPFVKSIPHPAHPAGGFRQKSGCDGAGPVQSDDPGHVFGAGSSASFLSGAVAESNDQGRLADVRGADSPGNIDLVAGHREQADPGIIN
jgi:hypothetical protein